jgi:iron(III) transport system permease protein
MSDRQATTFDREQDSPSESGVIYRLISGITPAGLAIGMIIAIIAYLVMVPLGFLLINTLTDAGGVTLSGFNRAYLDDPYFGTMLTNSLVFSVGTAALAVTLGTWLAFVQARTDIPLKGIMFAASIAPLILPAVLYAFAWLLLGDPNIGVINSVLKSLDLPPINILSVGGMIWCEGIHLSSIAFLLMVAAFYSMDPSLEESAFMSGARRLKIVSTITLPLLRPALISSTLLIFVLALESFETPSILGLQSGIYVFTSRIYSALHKYPVDYGVAGAYAIGLLIIACIGLFISARLSRNARSFQTVTGKAFRPRPMNLGRWRYALGTLVALYFFFAVILPVGVLIYASFLPFYRVPSMLALQSMSLNNYRALFNMSAATNAFSNSVVLGLSSATAVMGLTAIAAWVVVRSTARGRRLLDIMAFSPLIIPGIVLGVSLAYVYLRVPLPIYGTLWVLFIAYTTKYLPYGMRYATAAMVQTSSDLEESSATSGASWGQTFRYIILPIASKGVLAGWMYIVIVSFRELSSSILLYSPGREVISILIWDQFNNGRLTTVAAIGVLLILMLLTLVLIARWLGSTVGLEGSTAK